MPNGLPLSSHETRLHIKQIKNEGLLLSTGNSTQQSGVVKESRKEETRVYLTDSLRCKPEANTALQTSYTPIKNKNRKKPENTNENRKQKSESPHPRGSTHPPDSLINANGGKTHSQLEEKEDLGSNPQPGDHINGAVLHVVHSTDLNCSTTKSRVEV